MDENMNMSEISFSSGGLEEVHISPVMKSDDVSVQKQDPLPAALPSSRSADNIKSTFTSMFSRVKTTTTNTIRKPSMSSTSPPVPIASVTLPTTPKPGKPIGQLGTYRDIFREISFDVFVTHVEQSYENVRSVMEFIKKVSQSEEVYGKSLLSLANRDTSIVTKIFRKKTEEDKTEGTVRSMLREVSERMREEGHLRVLHANEVTVQCFNPLKAFLRGSPAKDAVDNAGKEYRVLLDKRFAAQKARQQYAKACAEFDKIKHSNDGQKIAKAQQKMEATQAEATRLIESANATLAAFYSNHLIPVYEIIQDFDTERVEQVRQAMHCLVNLRTIIIDRYGPALPLSEAISSISQEDEIRAFLAQPEVAGSIEHPLDLHGTDDVDTRSNASEHRDDRAASESQVTGDDLRQ